MELVITPRTISSDNPSSVPVVFLTWLVVSYTFACATQKHPIILRNSLIIIVRHLMANKSDEVRSFAAMTLKLLKPDLSTLSYLLANESLAVSLILFFKKIILNECVSE